MTELHVLRVFTDARGNHGNPLGVFTRPGAIPEDRYQAVAADLNFSETVFVEDVPNGRVRIFTPGVELPLAGHPLVGAAWLLDLDTIRPPAGDVDTWAEGDVRWIRGRPEWAPDFDFVQIEDAAGVNGMTSAPAGLDHVMCWAWSNEREGQVRARMFAPRYGITEDEATGSAAMRLIEMLGRPLTIVQGHGSLLYAKPGPDGSAEVGGRVVLDEVRAYAL